MHRRTTLYFLQPIYQGGGARREVGYGGDTLREGIIYTDVGGVSPEEAYTW